MPVCWFCFSSQICSIFKVKIKTLYVANEVPPSWPLNVSHPAVSPESLPTSATSDSLACFEFIHQVPGCLFSPGPFSCFSDGSFLSHGGACHCLHLDSGCWRVLLCGALRAAVGPGTQLGQLPKTVMWLCLGRCLPALEKPWPCLRAGNGGPQSPHQPGFPAATQSLVTHQQEPFLHLCPRCLCLLSGLGSRPGGFSFTHHSGVLIRF